MVAPVVVALVPLHAPNLVQHVVNRHRRGGCERVVFRLAGSHVHAIPFCIAHPTAVRTATTAAAALMVVPKAPHVFR